MILSKRMTIAIIIFLVIGVYVAIATGIILQGIVISGMYIVILFIARACYYEWIDR
jgi:hypothetical protein